MLELPYGFPGHLFRSPMPFTVLDPQGMLFTQYQGQGIEVVVLLVEDELCISKSGRNLRLFYQEQGLEVIYLPIPDFQVPSLPALDAAIRATMQCAQAGKNIVVHCYAGLGRTGMFLACLARRVHGMAADESIRWVRSYLPTAIETSAQIHIIREYDKGSYHDHYER